MSIYQKFGLRKIINASGKMTVLGASAVHSEVAQALSAAAMDYVDIHELMIAAGRKIAQVTGAENGCPTAGAAPGIAIATAAVIAGENLTLVERVPNTDGLKNEIILQKGHSVNFGASLPQMIALGGGKVVEVGQANHVEKDHILRGINEKTAALFYIKSHHAVQKGMQSLETIVAIAKERNIPIIVDAAAEEDFKYYIASGADIVIYSGGKALEGPTSGLICGRDDLIKACHMQYKGIGRAMKVGKEAIIGLMTALDRYESKEDDSQGQINRMNWLINELSNVPGIKGSLVQDEAGRDIYRAQLTIDEKIAGINAVALVENLEAGNPAIYTRNYYANIGIINIDPRPLLMDQEKVITSRIREIISECKRKEKK
ncbi:DgaE family pyridoxal phosphate-dependent ammonia lyase [Pelosinus fermentans]|uniref:Pyridoxal phosphate-dependent enzyme n=1 Tax=Pelosinus fermentans JBW45 TaxID=1192197 RepID=I8TUK4_9FIRM|nr:DgaE family pyridoxal phosphate-dependent ammonia lyase [Pelosinus fermentans]AJQ26726.1 pyridoxal phosphate-dependent enzyme [Pelosinus fermentans JBW45]